MPGEGVFGVGGGSLGRTEIQKASRPMSGATKIQAREGAPIFAKRRWGAALPQMRQMGGREPSARRWRGMETSCATVGFLQAANVSWLVARGSARRVSGRGDWGGIERVGCGFEFVAEECGAVEFFADVAEAQDPEDRQGEGEAGEGMGDFLGDELWGVHRGVRQEGDNQADLGAERAERKENCACGDGAAHGADAQKGDGGGEKQWQCGNAEAGEQDHIGIVRRIRAKVERGDGGEADDARSDGEDDEGYPSPQSQGVGR